jgi:transcriptional regulator with XRE-family HTH domain
VSTTWQSGERKRPSESFETETLLDSMTSLPSIELGLLRKLQDREYRQKFFLAEASAKIARQLVRLRKRRGLSQRDLATEVGMQQPRISQVERADYMNWSFNTLRRLAEAMDARIRVIIEASEDVLFEYAEPTATNNISVAASKWDADQFAGLGSQASARSAAAEESGQLDLLRIGGVNGPKGNRQQPSHPPRARDATQGSAISANRPSGNPRSLLFSEVPTAAGVTGGHSLVSTRAI